MMGRDDVVYDSQSKPGTAGFRGEKRVEYFRLCFVIHANPYPGGWSHLVKTVRNH